MGWLFFIIICDETRRPRRGAPAADQFLKCITVNPALPRRASERPGGDGALIKL